MITTFNEYEKINEGWRGDLTALMILVASVMTTDSRNPLDNKTIENYVKTMNIANQDTLVQQAIKDFKDYVRMDSQILNKQEVYTKIDNTPILYRKNDAICYKLYQQMKNKYPSMDASCWCSTTSDGKSVIFLAKDASYNVMLHELSHAIEPVVKIDPRILDNFDFNKNRAQIGFLYMMMTDFNFKMTSDLTRENSGALLPIAGRSPDVFTGFPLSVIFAITFFSNLSNILRTGNNEMYCKFSYIRSINCNNL